MWFPICLRYGLVALTVAVCGCSAEVPVTTDSEPATVSLADAETAAERWRETFRADDPSVEVGVVREVVTKGGRHYLAADVSDVPVGDAVVLLDHDANPIGTGDVLRKGRSDLLTFVEVRGDGSVVRVGDLVAYFPVGQAVEWQPVSP